MTNEELHFVIEGVDLDDGSRIELASLDNSGEARQWLAGYVRGAGDAGGWSLIEIYDTRGDDAERIAFWERTDACDHPGIRAETRKRLFGMD